MVYQTQYIYWTIIKQLVGNGDYQLLQMSSNHSEVWLETTKKQKPKIIRILCHDIDWSNFLQRDMEITLGKIDQLRKKLYHRNLDALNIYISTYAPVDDWEYRFEKPLQGGDKGQTRLHSIFIQRDKTDEGFQKLSKLVYIPFEMDRINIEHEHVEALKNNVITNATQKAKQEQELFHRGKPFFTYLLIIIQVLMFAVLELNGGSTDTQTLIKYGAKENVLIVNGEWWRFFTPIFLHIGIFHLLMNTLALYYLGTAVERIFGRVRFLFVYLLAGLAGSVASFVFNANVSAGASGAIFGCFGALLFFGTVYPSLFFRTMGTNILGIIFINLVFGFVVPGIDNAGHIGGLIGGFLASSIVHLPKQKQYKKRAIGFIITLACLFGMLYIGFVHQPFADDPVYAVKLAKEQIERNEIEQAYETLHNVAENDGFSIEVYFYLSYVEINLGKYEEAREHLVTLTENAPQIHEAQFNLALVYMELEDIEKAKQSVERALQEDPENQNYIDLLNEIEKMND